MTLSLFGPEQPWTALLDERPVLSGRHPLHLYHGYLGARAFRERGTLCCYDPAFQAGYPKTPVFDSGSRPAELFLTLAGGDYRPAAYKIGLAVCCLAAPFLLFLAARAGGLNPVASWLATAAGLLVWWGTPGRLLLEDGELDLLLAGLSALAETGLLVRFHRSRGLASWLGLLATASLGWFAQPVFFITLLPLLLVFYVSVGAKHRPAWHVALLASLAGGLASNFFWLFDWFDYWWIRSPLHGQFPALPHRTFHTLWAAGLWGDDFDRAMALVLIGLAAIGIAVLNQTGQRPAARLFGLGTAFYAGLAIAGLVWEPLGRIGTPRLLVPGLWFAVIPAAHAVFQGLRLGGRLIGWHAAAPAELDSPSPLLLSPKQGERSRGEGGRISPPLWRAALLIVGLLATVAVVTILPRGATNTLIARYASTSPFTIGFSAEDQSLIESLRANTTQDARILWEDGLQGSSQWTALLPILTDRAYLGGLDPEVPIDHGYAALVDQSLAGRPLADWTDAELSDFCRRYNVGWVVCRKSATKARFGGWREAEPVASLGGDSGGILYRLPFHSFALWGQARLLQADCRHIALADVVPEDGKVVLSLHYQAGLKVSPSRVQIEKEPDPEDPIPFIRLRLQGPVTRVTLTWRDR
jgi:hypothetical protein